MMNRLTLILCLLVFGSAHYAAPAEGDVDQSPSAARVTELRKKIEALRAKNDVTGLRLLGAEVKAEWLAKKSPAYYPVILDVCLAMNSTRTTEPEIDEAIRDLAVAAIDSPAEKPVAVVAKILLFLHGDYDYSTGQPAGAAWVKERQTRAERWLTVCTAARVQNAAMPKPTGPLVMHVSPPEGLPSGVGPSSVKDPVLRKKFEEAIERNRQLSEAYSKKSAFQDLEKDVAANAARYLVDAFAKPPFRTDELADLLAKHRFPKDHTATLMKEVRRREAAESERAAKYARFTAGTSATGKTLQYSMDGTTFRDAPFPLFIEQGAAVTFKAPFAGDACEWQGSSGATGNGAENKVKFSAVSAADTDFKTVTATRAGGMVTAHVIVFKLIPVYTPQDDFPGRDHDAYGIGEWINLSYKTEPAGISESQIGGLRWVVKSGGGDLYGGAGGLGTYECSGVGGSFILDLQRLGQPAKEPLPRK